MPWLSNCRVDLLDEEDLGVQYLMEMLNVALSVVVAEAVFGASRRVAALEKAVAA